MTTDESANPASDESDSDPAYLVFDTESIPDGKLIAMIKYPDDKLDPHAAVLQAQAEAREQSRDGSDFLPVSYQLPVAVCVARVDADYRLTKITCLDTPHYRPRELTDQFWRGVTRLPRAKLVTFNGRGFDLPLMELAAFRYGCGSTAHFRYGRNRYTGDIDLLDWLANFGATRLKGGLNLLSKLLGKPGKMGIAGDQVYAMHQAGKIQEINDYCLSDTLDTYFVFLRTRVMVGDISLEMEQERVIEAKDWLTKRAGDAPALRNYLEHWGDWKPWP